jgi:hypothetical protein
MRVTGTAAKIGAVVGIAVIVSSVAGAIYLASRRGSASGPSVISQVDVQGGQKPASDSTSTSSDSARPGQGSDGSGPMVPTPGPSATPEPGAAGPGGALPGGAGSGGSTTTTDSQVVTPAGQPAGPAPPADDDPAPGPTCTRGGDDHVALSAIVLSDRGPGRGGDPCEHD